MRLLLIGPPGSGKGTQAEHIASRFGLVHISSGDLLRAHVRDGTAIGRTAESYMRRGDLVPDGIVMDILRKPVQAASDQGGYILDGFPRTVEQAASAYLVAKEVGAAVQVALFLSVPREELVRRLVGRGHRDGRADDTEEVIAHRLDVFDEHTVPMLAYYASREILVTVDGAQPVETVTAATLSQLEKVKLQLDA